MTPIARQGLSENLRKFLMLITFTEGTDKEDSPYNELFGYDNFVGYDTHPNIVVNKGGYYSSAAGRYQILKRTYDSLKMKSFTPEAQDEAAIQLLKNCGAYPFIVKGEFAEAIKKCNRIWASLPGSPFGQPTKSLKNCLAFIEAA